VGQRVIDQTPASGPLMPVTTVDHGDERVRVPKTADILAARIRGQIARGELREGELLPPEPEMLVRWGVGRPSLREALRILESESLLEIQKGNVGGAIVRHPRVTVAARNVGVLLQLRGTTLKDVYDTRLLLEPAAVARAAERRDPDGLARLEEILEAQESLVAQPGEWARAAVRFHEAIVGMAQSPTLELLSDLLSEIINLHQVAEVTRSGGAGTANRRKSNEVHRRLFQLIRDGRSQDAQALWRDHIEKTNARYFSGRPVSHVVDLFS
jgi:GntR family transcriptional regulator, transcriptional repressor for pyruvate dehydrogenase complex